MTHTKNATMGFRAIPRERLVKKIGRTVLGAAVVAGAVLAGKAGWPWYAVLGIGGVGFHIVSAELVEKAARFGVAILRDVLGALARKNGTPNG